ncbi:alpha/beta hydrolase family protein [Granulosicoccus antarcticus]|nr:alpha/beta fold hydrolase [Granulosicoccus antarcticus]
MNASFPLLVSVAVAATTLPLMAVAQSSEETVTLQSEGQDLVATLQLPEGNPAPVVLLLHGFTGTRDELVIPSTDEGVFERTADTLADNGYASLRIDFRGSGDSIADFTYESTTFEGQISDALAAIDYLEKLDSVDGDDLYVIGWSQGGVIAAAAAGRSGKPDALALWQAVGDLDASYGGMMGEETLAAGKAAASDHTLVATLSWGPEVSLNSAFFHGIEALDPMAEIAAYTGPLFVTQGTADTTVLPASADAYIAAHEGPEQLWTADMGHLFNVYSSTKTLDSMIADTLSFFDDHKD